MALRYCKNCIHFTSNNECMRFRYNDLVFGIVKYEDARVARYTTSMCGEKAFHYKERPHVSYERVMSTSLDSFVYEKSDTLRTGLITPVIVCSAEGCSIVYNSGGFDENDEVVYMGMEYDNEHTTMNDVY